MAYRILIADDYRMIRQMLEMTVAHADDLELAGTAADAAEAIAFCRSNQVDLVVMDVVMGSGMDGINAAKEIKSMRPETKILIITSMAEADYLRRAREIGIESFWHKEVQEQPLLDVIRRTLAGESIYPGTMPEVWLGQIVSTELTAREIDVLRELVGGASNAEIAERLGISARTVKQHIIGMLQKTGLQNRLQLALQARGGGLVVRETAQEEE